MEQITEVRINKFELKHSDVDDPVAQKVSWEPAVGGGANFRTHKLKVSPMSISVERSKGYIAFALLFTFVGAVPLVLGFSPMVEELVPSIFLVGMGAVFMAIGLAILLSKNLLTFDRARGIYFRGGKYLSQTLPNRKQQGMLSEIHALQLVRETVSSSKGGAYTSYELNLVFKDGERLNVMDHGDGADIENSAKVLGGFLGVPVWQAVY